MQPRKKPLNPKFSCGPTNKYPDFSKNKFAQQLLGRSHRSKECLAQIKLALSLTRELLPIPKSYKIAIVPASDTGAMEMAMWNLLGIGKVSVIAFDVFGNDWVKDVCHELKLETQIINNDEFTLPDIDGLHKDNDTVFTFNGTTSGMHVGGYKFFKKDMDKLKICDATSAIFAMPVPIRYLDVTTFSWQKTLGGEAGFGMIILSPKAVARLEEYNPPWPIPKIFRLKNELGKVKQEIFSGIVINTISMLVIEDYIRALSWVKKIGGLQASILKTKENYLIIEKWIGKSNFEFCVKLKKIRSSSSVTIIPKLFTLGNFSQKEKWGFIDLLVADLARNNIAFDIRGHAKGYPCLRIWCGATVEKENIARLLPWLDYVFVKYKGSCEINGGNSNSRRTMGR